MEACGCLGGHGKLRASMGDAWLCGVPVPWGCGEPGSGAVIRVGAGAISEPVSRYVQVCQKVGVISVGISIKYLQHSDIQYV